MLVDIGASRVIVETKKLMQYEVTKMEKVDFCQLVNKSLHTGGRSKDNAQSLKIVRK